jgi:hypothetical protein
MDHGNHQNLPGQQSCHTDSPTPLILHEYQKKGVTEFAFRKSLILKGAISVVLD